MKNLTVFALAADDHLVQPEEFEDVHGTTSALAILTDFRSHKPHMLDAQMEASEALELMLAEDVRTKLVIDEKREFIGVIGIDDLSEHHMALKRIELGVRPDELLVRDLMHSRRNIRAIDFDEFAKARVSDVVSTLKKHHQDYLLVVDQEAHHIRGIVSARDIARRLHTPVQIEKELTFVDIFTAVKAH
ncbi:CBS domain-containing protein [Cellvibrio japonicus]|uniref:Uvs112 n=1 Tax=Cellvibrio japonicus (strain Ueda107) TaxID=498211 RepID=B3PFE2_CELJU|nr:CBS domain-containing protein [Cellvibrio japonicus]ACE85171.1 Uvs112 [Cellvibrio japonicus Ueda107]QEI10815.1 CBS domain-containing protein [Cellvibrio japonicus]QEI14391.1 CBS domain-containing protein [Cellvibrio japonicus]QEI17969.1 CBS domain-containing protein [Cellvibrio japonicus]